MVKMEGPQQSAVGVAIMGDEESGLKLWITLAPEVLDQLGAGLNAHAHVTTDDGPLRLTRGSQAESLGEVVEVYINLR